MLSSGHYTFKKYVDKLEQGQKVAAMMVRVMENKFFEETWTELCNVSLEMRRLSGGLIVALVKYLNGFCTRASVCYLLL